MKTLKTLTIAMVIIVAVAVGYMTLRDNGATAQAYAQTGGVVVTEVSQRHSIVQVIDRNRRVICYASQTPSGAGISCVKY